MNGFERRKEKKIQQIYQASLQLFSKYGFQKVSVNEIAQTAQVSPATIYNYFGTKEQLYAEMLMNWMDKQLGQYDEILDSALSFPEKTKEIMLREAQNLKLLSDRIAIASSSDWNDWRGKVAVYGEEKAAAFFMKYVSLGKREGYIRQDQSEEIAILYFTMFKNELGRYWDGERSPEELTGILDPMLELFFYGLVGQGGKLI
jgi:Transcriptional regulator